MFCYFLVFISNLNLGVIFYWLIFIDFFNFQIQLIAKIDVFYFMVATLATLTLKNAFLSPKFFFSDFTIYFILELKGIFVFPGMSIISKNLSLFNIYIFYRLQPIALFFAALLHIHTQSLLHLLLHNKHKLYKCDFQMFSQHSITCT